MSKLTLTTIQSGYYTTTQLNANFQAIVDALDGVVWRDGTAPNAMGAHLDMNGYNIINCANITNANAVVATDTETLGGYLPSAFPRKAENATISGTWTFSVDPSFTYVLSSNAAVEMTAPIRTTPVTLTPGVSVTPDCNDGNYFTLTAGQNFTLENPANAPTGLAQTIVIRVKQDATGSRLITWGSKYVHAGGTDPALSTGGNDVDLITATYDPSSDTWMAAVYSDLS